MELTYSTRRVVIAALTLAALTISVPFLANRLNAKATVIPASRVHQSHHASNETEEFHGFVESLPSYRAIEASLEQLATNSANILKAASKNDDESLSLAALEYRTSLRQVGDNFATLADRVGRDRAEAAFEELVHMDVGFDWTLDELVLGTQTQE